MARTEQNEQIDALAQEVFSLMLEEIVTDVVLDVHREETRARAICKLCNTRCGQVHVPPSAAQVQATSSASRAVSPANESQSTNGVSNASSSNNGNILFECVQCKRQVAYNRYAQHLASCMGVNGGARRGAARTASNKLSSDPPRSDSPYMGSEAGNVSDEANPSPTKSKSKSKAKKKEEAEFALHRKRTGSPQVSPPKPKRGRPPGSAVARLKSDPDVLGAPLGTSPSTSPAHTKMPSKLRESSIADITGGRGRSSSVDSAVSSAGLPTAPATASGAGTPAKRGRGRPPKNSGGPGRPAASNAPAVPAPKPPSPPRPPSVPVRMPEPDYLDVEGEETGSSTDTDSQ